MNIHNYLMSDTITDRFASIALNINVIIKQYVNVKCFYLQQSNDE